MIRKSGHRFSEKIMPNQTAPQRDCALERHDTIAVVRGLV
jgi:hypothetical protein